MKKFKIGIIIFLSLFSIQSCDKEDLTILNPNEAVIETFYQNEAELLSAVNAIYATIQSSNLYAREYWFLHDLRGDDNQSGGGQLETPRNQLLTGNNDPGNSVANAVWTGLYQVIHRSNIVITEGPNTENVNSESLKRFVAEAKFARGWAYYELGTLWGGVPIYTTYAQSLGDTKPRSTQQDVFLQVVQDFEEAAASLPLNYDASNSGRFTKGAALAMLGRMHMFMNEYSKAKNAFDQIVQSGEYSLTSEYDDNFQEESEYSSESLLEIGYADIGGFNWNPTGDGLGNEEAVRTQEYSAVGWRNLIPSLSLLNEFETEFAGDEKTDPRFEKSFYSIGDTFNNDETVLEDNRVQGNVVMFQNQEQKISWRKYSLMYKLDPGGFATGGINMRVIRYGEVLINLAECELEVGSPTRSIELLNIVRARPSVDMPPYPTTRFPVSNNQQIFEAVVHEKRVELNSEQIRNRDILRWRAQGKLANDPISYFTANKHELLPIPQSEIDNNASLEQADQNPGY